MHHHTIRVRRRHTKSRNGCDNCKRRKVKCDEARPACFNCKRHGVSCSLADAAPQVTPSTEARAASSDFLQPTAYHEGPSPTDHLPSREPKLIDQLAPLPPDELWLRGFELMHHYCTVTADTLSLRQDMAYVWRVAVPREGYKHSFVVHGILAIAAAHKAYLVPSRREFHLKLCDYHSTVGSEGFRHELQKITQDNWTALFSFASVLVLYSFSLPVRSTEGKLSNPIDNLLELVSLVRGIKTTMAPLVPRLYHSEFAPMGYGIWPAESDGSPNGYPTLDNTFLPSDLWDVARQLRAFQETEVPLDSLVHYRKAVNDLEYSARLVASAGAHAESGAVIAWLYSLDEEILVDIGAHGGLPCNPVFLFT
ncbi:hypothetical protein ACJZ2D_000448 [Fusarium nematophilum]